MNLPFMKFFPDSYLRDTRALSLSARGAWMDLICSMWYAKPRGIITLPVAGFARLFGVDESAAQATIEELSLLQICESVTLGNGNVTVSCRRMVREEKERESTRYRVKRFRNAKVTEASNGPVTPKKSEVRSQKSYSREQREENTCAEPSASCAAASPNLPPVVSIQMNTGEEYGIGAELIDEYRTCYPAVNVIQELRAMKAWSLSNPTKRKTKSGMRRFMNGWLSKAQNKGGSDNSTRPRGHGPGKNALHQEYDWSKHPDDSWMLDEVPNEAPK